MLMRKLTESKHGNSLFEIFENFNNKLKKVKNKVNKIMLTITYVGFPLQNTLI